MKVLVVDDHPVFREGLSALLGQTGADTLVLQAGNVAEALALITQHADLDVVLLDLVMPGLGGLPAISEFGRSRPDLPVIILSSSEDPRDARGALAQGALGYVPKSAGQQTLLAAIRLVLNGDVYVPPLVLTETTASPGTISAGNVYPGTVYPGREDASRSVLTERQVDVLRRLSEGLPNRTIAVELGVSEKTVKAHITAIFKALNVVNRTQAAAVGRQLGLI